MLARAVPAGTSQGCLAGPVVPKGVPWYQGVAQHWSCPRHPLGKPPPAGHLTLIPVGRSRLGPSPGTILIEGVTMSRLGGPR